MGQGFERPRRWAAGCLALASLGWGSAQVGAQVQSVDPDTAFGTGSTAAPTPVPDRNPAAVTAPAPSVAAPPPPLAPEPLPAPAERAAPGSAATYRSDELVAASQGAFGKAARDVAVAIGDVLKKQGEPNGYIIGKEGGGAFIFGLRYGSGNLHQKGREVRPVYWSGPSIGFDAGAGGGDTFMLVYNLDDPETLFSRFGAGEGQAYVVGGLNVSYLRKENVVLIPVRMGVGVRLGVNAGYMKFSRKQNWMPF